MKRNALDDLCTKYVRVAAARACLNEVEESIFEDEVSDKLDDYERDYSAAEKAALDDCETVHSWVIDFEDSSCELTVRDVYSRMTQRIHFAKGDYNEVILDIINYVMSTGSEFADQFVDNLKALIA